MYWEVSFLYMFTPEQVSESNWIISNNNSYFIYKPSANGVVVYAKWNNEKCVVQRNNIHQREFLQIPDDYKLLNKWNLYNIFKWILEESFRYYIKFTYFTYIYIHFIFDKIYKCNGIASNTKLFLNWF